MVAPTHYSGEYNLGTCALPCHSTAKVLYAGSRRRTRAPPKCGDSEGWITASLASGTCPPADAALLMALCTGVTEPCVNVCATPELCGNPKVSI